MRTEHGQPLVWMLKMSRGVPQEGVWACQQIFRRLAGQLQAASGHAKAAVDKATAVSRHFTAAPGTPSTSQSSQHILIHTQCTRLR